MPPAGPESPAANAAIECIDLTSAANRRAEGPDTILFDLGGGRRVRNHLPGRCPGLARSRDFGALVFEQQSGRLCPGDIVRAIDPQAAASTSIPCILGRFEPVAGDQPR